MADSWKLLSLKEAGVSLIDCVHKTPPAATDGYPYIAIPQMKGGWLDFDADPRLISEPDFVNWTQKAKPQEHDVVLSRRCNPGVTAPVKERTNFALGQNLVLLRSTGEVTAPEYLRWLVSGPLWWDQISTFINVGAVFESLRCADVPKFTLPIPPLPEQRRIAEILGALDDKIELNRKMNQTLEEMAQAIFKSWFIDFDGHTEFVDSDLGRIPKGWSTGTVQDLCNRIFSGGTPSTKMSEYWDGPLPWLTSGETRNPLVIQTEKRISQAAVENSTTRLAGEGTTVIAGAGQGKTRGQTSLLALDTYINQSVVALEPGSRSSSLHLFFNLERRYEQFRAISDAHSSRGSLTTKLLAGIQTVIPTQTWIRRFDQVVGPMVKRMISTQRETLVLAGLRDTLLPKLISGELRVRDAEKTVEEVA